MRMRLNDTFKNAWASARASRNLIIFFVLAHAVFLGFGQWMVAKGYPGVLELRAEQLKEIQNLPYLKPLTGILAGSLFLKIIYTFLFNLIFGAFLSTTMTGVIFFLPYLIAVWRGFIIGILVYGSGTTPLMAVVFYGTFLLEFGAYSISSAVGTDLGLSLMSPARKGVESRRAAIRIALRNGASLYILVAVLLVLGAVWEMSWIHYLGPVVNPAQNN